VSVTRVTNEPARPQKHCATTLLVASVSGWHTLDFV